MKKGLVTEKQAKELRRKRAGARFHYTAKVIWDFIKLGNIAAAIYGLNIISIKLTKILLTLSEQTYHLAIFSVLAFGILAIMLKGSYFVDREVKNGH